ncbi:MAG: endolytic transglycosylase MltG [Chloroflexi bacterium]|nr:endolytic transglycosylase MltG [Chloroflexota bacterium]
MARLLVVLFALIVIGAAVGIGYFVLDDSSSVLNSAVGQMVDPMAPIDPNDSTKVTVNIPPGATANDIGTELQQRGLVRSALLFRLAADQADVGSDLAAGDYELSKSMSTPEIVQVLARGEVKRGLVATIPEGWRSEQIADRLQATGFAARDDFLKAVAAPQSVPGTDSLPQPSVPRLEGYLFPETYEVPQAVSGSRAAELMVRMFSQRVGDELRTSSDSRLSPQQVITLASIVEREARVPSERATIASVYLNRLAQNMPLQADPTVQYAVATRDGAAAASYDYWRPLTADDLDIASPYNTYQHTGLPPGPICNPGEASIEAVLQPAQTDYLYFVAQTDGSGTHLFAKTLDEHNANIAKVNTH